MKTNNKKRKIYLFIAIFCFMGAIVGISESNILMFLVYLLIGLIFLHLWRKKRIHPATPEAKTEAEINATTQPFQNHPPQIKSMPNDHSVDTAPGTNRITKRFSVAGTSYYQNEIESLAFENFDYSLTKKEISEQYYDGGTIYKYDFSISNVSLEPEPTNEHDSNAVKVIADNVHIGYIKQGKCSEVKNLLNSGKDLSISIEIYGGPYKFVSVDYDDDTDKDVYSIEQGTSDFRAKVSISYIK